MTPIKKCMLVPTDHASANTKTATMPTQQAILPITALTNALISCQVANTTVTTQPKHA